MSRSNGFVTRFVVVLISISMFTRNLLVLASPVGQQSLKRPDPSRHFKPYNGVYDVTNRHYWASTAFTGIHGYAIAGIWLLFGFGFGSYVIVKNYLFGRASPVPHHPDFFYIITFLMVVFFTLLAIVASSFILAANRSSHKRVNRFIDTIFSAASDASKAIRRVINSLVDMQTRLRPYDQQTCDLLNVTTHRLRRESLLIRNFVDNTKLPSDKAVEMLYSTTLSVVIINLSLLVVALVLLILHWHPGIMVIIFCCWILTTLSWVLTGLDYFLQTFAKDTCAAFGNFEQNPANGSLRFIHPCASPDDYKLLVQIGHTVHDFISQLNTKLTELQAVLEMDDGKEDTLGIREICNPFAGAPNYTYAPQYCPKDATPIGDLSSILSRFTCYSSNSAEECMDGGRFIPESSYVMAGAYIHSIQDLINVFPDLLSLTHCSSVKQAFSDIAMRQCTPLKASVKMLWLSALSLSIIMMILVSLWVAKLHVDRQRSFAMFHIVPKPV